MLSTQAGHGVRKRLLETAFVQVTHVHTYFLFTSDALAYLSDLGKLVLDLPNVARSTTASHLGVRLVDPSC